MKEPAPRASAGATRLKVTPIGEGRTSGRRGFAAGERPGRCDRRPGDAFVGREREMQELRRSLDDALAGRGALFLLAGEPGIGKTRLSQEIGAAAEALGFEVLWGRCHEDEGAPPYWPWVQILRALVRNCDTATLRAEVGPGASDIALIVAEIRERLPDLPTLVALKPEQARFPSGRGHRSNAQVWTGLPVPGMKTGLELCPVGLEGCPSGGIPIAIPWARTRTAHKSSPCARTAAVCAN